MRIVGLIVVLLALFVFIGGIITWVMGETDAWPYFLIPIGPFIWGIMQLTKRKQLLSLNPANVETFQKENCIGCLFADKEAIGSNRPWCTRSEPPEWDPKHLHCRSRQIKWVDN